MSFLMIECPEPYFNYLSIVSSFYNAATRGGGGGEGGGGGGVTQQSFYTGRFPSELCTLALLYTIFDRKGDPFI